MLKKRRDFPFLYAKKGSKSDKRNHATSRLSKADIKFLFPKLNNTISNIWNIRPYPDCMHTEITDAHFVHHAASKNDLNFLFNE